MEVIYQSFSWMQDAISDGSGYAWRWAAQNGRNPAFFSHLWPFWLQTKTRKTINSAWGKLKNWAVYLIFIIDTIIWQVYLNFILLQNHLLLVVYEYKSFLLDLFYAPKTYPHYKIVKYLWKHMIELRLYYICNLIFKVTAQFTFEKPILMMRRPDEFYVEVLYNFFMILVRTLSRKFLARKKSNKFVKLLCQIEKPVMSIHKNGFFKIKLRIHLKNWIT